MIKTIDTIDIYIYFQVLIFASIFAYFSVNLNSTF